MWCVCRRPSNVLVPWTSQEVMWCTRQVIVHRGFRCPAVLGRADKGGRHGDLRFWCTLGGCQVVVARCVDHQHTPAACTAERSVGKRSKRSRVALNVSSLLFTRHHVVLGADANTSLSGFEDGRFVGDVTVPLTKARSCADFERAGALNEFMLSFGLRADNSWSDWDCVTRVGWRHESR